MSTRALICISMEEVIDIFEHLRSLERYHGIPYHLQTIHFLSGSLNKTTILNKRRSCINAIYQLAELNHLKLETSFLAISFFDVYISQNLNMIEDCRNTRVLIVVVLIVASKIEEIYPPSLAYIARLYQVNVSDCIQMERQLLCSLDFRCTRPTVYNFLSLYGVVQETSKECINLALSYLKVIVLDKNFFQYLPSKLAAAALTMACEWSPILEKFTKYLFKDSILNCIISLSESRQLILQTQLKQLSTVLLDSTHPDPWIRFESIDRLRMLHQLGMIQIKKHRKR